VSTAIRLTRLGRKKRPFYRLVAVDSRTRRDGAYLANLGYYNPFVEPFEVKLHEQEILAWLKKGAQMSDTARALLRSQGVLFRWSLIKEGLAAAEIETKMAEWQTSADKRVADFSKKREAAAAAKAKAEAEKLEAERLEAEKAEAEKAAAEKAEADKAAAEAAEAEAQAAADEAPAEEPAAEAPADAPEPDKTEEG